MCVRVSKRGDYHGSGVVNLGNMAKEILMVW